MPAPPSPSVLVADAQPLFRTGLVQAFRRRHLAVVGEVADGHRAVERIAAGRPDVALVDLHLPGLDALGVLDALRPLDLPTRVVVLSGCCCDEDLRRARRLGAAGVVGRRRDAAGMIDAVLTVARGGTVDEPALDHGRDRERFARVEERPLTPREREVLALMTEGLSGPEIARRLFVSPSTVKTHVERLYEKLGVSHRGAAVAEAMRRGLVR